MCGSDVVVDCVVDDFVFVLWYSYVNVINCCGCCGDANIIDFLKISIVLCRELCEYFKGTLIVRTRNCRRNSGL